MTVEKVVLGKVKSIKRRKRRKSSIWQQTLKKDLRLIEVRLYQEECHANMLIVAFNLEKQRNPREYIS